jgi:dTDP-4-amino-4,6-dideoxygalactose transaminase
MTPLKTKIPFFTVARQNAEIISDLEGEIKKVIDGGIYADGPKTKEFERVWSELNGVKHTIFTGSGTAALEIGLKCLDVGKDTPVMVPTNTFIASASQLIPLDAEVKFLDSDESCNLNIDSLGGHNYGHLIGVNLYGQPLDLDKIFKKVKKEKFLLDACQSHFAEYKGKPCASYCGVSVFSFYVTKLLGAKGEAGCLCTNDNSLAEYARSLRNHGRSKDGYTHEYISGNLRGDEIQAAILLVKLKQKSEIINQRIQAVARYRKNLQNNPKIKLLPEIPGTVNYVMPVFVKEREEVRNKMLELGVGTLTHYPVSLNNQPAFSYLGYSRGDFPVAEEQCDTEISLPLFYGITDEEIDLASQAVLKNV